MTIRSDSERGVIRFHQAVRLQLRLLWLSRRPLGLLAVMVTALILVSELVSSTAIEVQFIVVLTAFFAGPTWAFAVWTGEPPSARSYMWSQPVNRTHQSLARVVAGLVWLWAMLSVALAIGGVAATVGGYADELSTISFEGWINLFVGPTVGYLMLSCVLLVFERPIWWVIGLILLRFWVLNWDPAAGILEALGDFSLGSVLLGMLVGGELGPEVGPVWWIAWPLWIIAFSLLAWALARVHPDRLARWPSRILRKVSRD